MLLFAHESRPTPFASTRVCVRVCKNLLSFKSMEKVQSSAPPPPSTTDARQEMPAVSRIKKDLLSFGASLQEGFRYLKASLVGQVKKMRARSEKEASEADLQASKMQVEAADAAEDTKKHLDEPK